MEKDYNKSIVDCESPEEDYDAYVQARDDNWRRDLDSYIMRDPY